MLRPDYDEVPAVPADAEPDPHWAELMSGRTSLLPVAYMPTAMPGLQHGWRRFAAIVVIAMLLSATAGGICLTYGPGELINLVGR